VAAVQASELAGVVLYEVKRDLRKKGVLLIVAFTLFPLAVALIMRLAGATVEGEERLWAVMIGFDIGTGAAAGAMASLGLAGWSWLIAVIYGGDLFASDLREGGFRLIAVRPVGRAGYFAGKTLALTAFLAAAFAAAGATVALAAHIVAGPQKSPWMAPILGALIGVGSLPVAFAASLFGALTRNPVTGFVLGAAAYLLTGAAVGIALFFVILGDPLSPESWARYYEYLITASGVIPILAGPALPSILYYLLEFDNKFIPLPLPLTTDPELAAELVEVEITPLDVLPLYLASTALGIALLGYLNYRVVSRVDAG
jgi:ABC-type transport system involved in multi-copper enzyme maturation permease subunit